MRRRKVSRTAELAEESLQFVLNIGCREVLPSVQTVYQRRHDMFALSFFLIEQKTVKEVFSAHCRADLGFFVVIVQFSEVDNLVLTIAFGIAINLEHCLLLSVYCHRTKPLSRGDASILTRVFYCCLSTIPKVRPPILFDLEMLARKKIMLTWQVGAEAGPSPEQSSTVCKLYDLLGTDS